MSIISPSKSVMLPPVRFSGGELILMDGGSHGSTQKKFIKAISNDTIDIKYINLSTNNTHSDLKQMSSLLKELRKINALSSSEKPETIALPITFDVPLLNLADQMRSSGFCNIIPTLTGLSENKHTILNFLSLILAGAFF
jgi:hypothetical protein